jgi:hypothetical protein
MQLQSFQAFLQQAIDGGNRDAPVAVSSPDGLHFAFVAYNSTPMVKAFASPSAPYVSGRKNATRFVTIESNLAHYPNMVEARKSALTVAQLQKFLQGEADGKSVVLARAGLVKFDASFHAAAFRPVLQAMVMSITGKGRPAQVSRGGVPAFVVSCR